MITSDESAFIRAAILNPTDDTCRLVYADFLDEQGSEEEAARAALIRAQVAMPQETCGIHRYMNDWAGWNYSGGPAKRLDLTPRQVRLGLRHAAIQSDFRIPEVGNLVVSRGFVRGVSADIGYLLSRAEDWFNKYPIESILAIPAPDVLHVTYDEMLPRWHWVLDNTYPPALTVLLSKQIHLYNYQHVDAHGRFTTFERARGAMDAAVLEYGRAHIKKEGSS